MITVLTEDRAASANRLSAQPRHAAFTIADARNFEEVVQSLAANSSIIGICHASQPITPDWLGRAELCFRKVDRIDALTGLAAGPADVPQEGWPKASDRPAGPRVRSFPMGICRLMFPLTADTNSGFVAVRPEVVEFIGDLSPLDARTGRFKRMQDWVHEIVVRLDGQGRSVELLPDCGLDGVLGDQPFTMFDSGRIARSILKSDLEYAPGSEPTLLARLAIETMTGHEMGRAAADCLSYLSDKLGQKLENASLYSTEESATRTFAAMARASGQTELAHELVVESLLPRFEKSRIRRPLASYVRRSATEIRLFDLAAAGAFAAFNLSHDWSYKIFADLREIELHPNTAREGRAGMMFSDLDLTDLGALRGGVRLASPFSRPVRFRIDIVAVDGSSHYGLDRVVRANESLQLEERLPLEILTRCNISLFTEMANPNDQAQDAWARWTDLCLTSP
jgi:hypothetical protein